MALRPERAIEYENGGRVHEENTSSSYDVSTGRLPEPWDWVILEEHDQCLGCQVGTAVRDRWSCSSASFRDEMKTKEAVTQLKHAGKERK